MRTLHTARPWLLALALAAPMAAGAAPAAGVQQDVDHLLAFIETSNCSFYRNGTRSDAKAALAHVRMKYDYLAGRDKVASAKDFIELAASQSSLSGKPYQVMCPGSAQVPSRAWLSEELARWQLRR